MDSEELKSTVRTKCDLQNAFLEMFEKKIHVDIRLCVENTDVCIEAHKLILSVRSPVFADMCFREKHDNLDVIKVDGISLRILNLVVSYIYSDELKTHLPTELIEVAKAAHRFEIGGLIRVCKINLTFCSIDKTNIWSAIEASRFFQLETFGKRCLRILLSFCYYSRETLFEMPEFLQTSRSTLSFILKHRDIFIKSDFFWMEGIIIWLQHHKIRERFLLSAIQTFSLSYKEFLDLVEKYPDFFTFKETSQILCNILRPGMSEVPPWCEMELKKNEIQPISDYNDIITNALKINLKYNRKFPKSYFCEENEFEGLVMFEIKLTKHFPRMPHLVMLELVFGSSFVPRSNLELELFHCQQGSSIPIEKKVNFHLKITANHYYLMMNNQMRLNKNIPFVFSLKLRAHGLKKWGSDGPVSSRQYRVAKIPEDIFQNICLDADGYKTVSLTLLSDWMIFVDPKCDAKNHVLSAFYFDSDTKTEEV